MKKLLLCIILLAVITGVSLFAWSPGDLLTYPKCVRNDEWQINFGLGLDIPSYTRGQFFIPLTRVSVDKNVPIGGLPFFFGGLLSYSAQGVKDSWIRHNIATGVRFGYHFNWGVDKLDTYAVTTIGWIFHAGDNYGYSSSNFIFCTNIGARWFLNDFFGFWAETGFSYFNRYNLFDFGIGLAFKF